MLFLQETWSPEEGLQEVDEWKRKNPNRKYGSDTHKANSLPSILCYNWGKEGHISLECRG